MKSSSSITPTQTVETLLNWKLPNDDKPFDDKEYLEGFKQHAKEANDLFDAAFGDLQAA